MHTTRWGASCFGGPSGLLALWYGRAPGGCGVVAWGVWQPEAVGWRAWRPPLSLSLLSTLNAHNHRYPSRPIALRSSSLMMTACSLASAPAARSLWPPPPPSSRAASSSSRWRRPPRAGPPATAAHGRRHRRRRRRRPTLTQTRRRRLSWRRLRPCSATWAASSRAGGSEGCQPVGPSSRAPRAHAHNPQFPSRLCRAPSVYSFLPLHSPRFDSFRVLFSPCSSCVGHLRTSAVVAASLPSLTQS